MLFFNKILLSLGIMYFLATSISFASQDKPTTKIPYRQPTKDGDNQCSNADRECERFRRDLEKCDPSKRDCGAMKSDYDQLCNKK